MIPARKNEIDAVIVTYHPDLKLLHRCVESLASQVRYIFLVDNTPCGPAGLEEFLLSHPVEMITVGDNKGIAYAQNLGIKKSTERGSRYILLSDQDTIYPEKYAENMLSAMDSIEGRVAAIAPLFTDTRRQGEVQWFIKKSLWGFSKFYPKSGLYEVFHVIASGMIANTEYLNDIGLMDDDLFMDWVDLRWCWKAQKKGYKIIGNADVLIIHQLGDKALNLWFRKVNLRDPIRHYYITRNAFHLALRCDSLDVPHRIILFFKAFRYVVGYPLLSGAHSVHLKYILLAFWHGICGKLGKLHGTN